jgi:hypothetical protein
LKGEQSQKNAKVNNHEKGRENGNEERWYHKLL